MNGIQKALTGAVVEHRFQEFELLVRVAQSVTMTDKEHLVVDLAAKLGRALKALQFFIVQEGYPVLIPVRVDLINCNVHVRSRSFLSLISPTRIFSSSFTSFPWAGGSS